jgi:hypothetical protein
MDYRASMEGALIPSLWIQSAVGALEKLDILPTGIRCGALDIADEGKDKNAFAGRHGQRLEALRSWSGSGSDIYQSVQKAFLYCDEGRYTTLRFDADGMGAGVRGDARVINDQRGADRSITAEAYRGSEGPVNPDDSLVEGRRNADFFSNLKAMSWWSLRLRFQATYRAVTEGGPFDRDALISLSPQLDELTQLIQELSQPTYSISAAGKVVVDKAPSNFKSPNLADAVCIAFAPIKRRLYSRIEPLRI